MFAEDQKDSFRNVKKLKRFFRIPVQLYAALFHDGFQMPIKGILKISQNPTTANHSLFFSPGGRKSLGLSPMFEQNALSIKRKEGTQHSGFRVPCKTFVFEM